MQTKTNNKEVDFLEVLVEDVLGTQDYYARVISPMLSIGNSIALFPLPTTEYDHYFDGSYRQKMGFQISAKHEDQLAAYSTLQTIVAFLTSLSKVDSRVESRNNSYKFESMEILTDVNLIEKTDKYYIFAAQMVANLYIDNNL